MYVIEKFRIKEFKGKKNPHELRGWSHQSEFLSLYVCRDFFCFQQRQTETTLCVMWNKQSTYSD